MGSSSIGTQVNVTNEFEGVFEAHVTVGLPVDNDRFRIDCAELGVKPIVIVLPAGDTPVQPMTSAMYRGGLQLALANSRDLVRQLQARGYECIRLKVEAGHQNEGLPEDDEAAAGMPAEFYFEHHLKTSVANESEHQKLERIVTEHDAHLSSNAFEEGDDGSREFFVTFRSYGLGRASAETRVDEFVAGLQSAGIEANKRICEYCVYDSDLSVDRGWA